MGEGRDNSVCGRGEVGGRVFVTRLWRGLLREGVEVFVEVVLAWRSEVGIWEVKAECVEESKFRTALWRS